MTALNCDLCIANAQNRLQFIYGGSVEPPKRAEAGKQLPGQDNGVLAFYTDPKKYCQEFRI